jgi:hypothetical protein
LSPALYMLKVSIWFQGSKRAVIALVRAEGEYEEVSSENE